VSCNCDPSNHVRSLKELRELTRRQFFADCGVGVGKIALASLFAGGIKSAFANSLTSSIANPFAIKAPHFPAKAKHVIYLFMVGAPSQLDLYDYKPTLVKYDGKPVPQELVKDQRYAFIEKTASLLAARYKFAKHGQSGQELSEVIPHIASIADDIAIVRSMNTEQFNHAPAQIYLSTGSPLIGRPSMGSWVTYGLGCEAENLPAFVVLQSGQGTSGGPALWSNGFLPPAYQGVTFRAEGDPVLDVTNPAGIDPHTQRESLDLIHDLNQSHYEQIRDPEIAARISAYEMAYKMQASAPELTDLSKEPKHILDMYGVVPGKASFAANCLLARRLVERGVRFISLYHSQWDHHSDVAGGLKVQCGLTDKPSAALVKDLKQRGLLEDTLVIWGGEFGRTPMVETNPSLGRALGRDHHPVAYSIWMAGGGVKGGQTVGETDDLGFRVAKDPVHVHDLQATILHLLGLDHKRLTYHFQGRDFRLTDVEGEVVTKLLA